ncbi:GPW/gp25 family protein [Micromonospora siamensis]|uniref:IraD/Gp25-like domain-containing protein n=1 Tax=Micromonospora siamensis TaxID=299152 RepID=A0A1C5J373_9ACTN|nr:hypothetical protein [Micromonospora siamensis]SCG64476.1 hypothetical protein GA0074704_4028 [Micromonospora siamensis]
MDRTERERETARNRYLGWGLAFAETLPGIDITRDISFSAGPNGRVLDLVRGPDNLSQALAVALTTLRGSNVFDAEFGFDGLNALAEDIEPVLIREQVRVAVITLLHRDPRVRRIVDVNLDDGRLGAEGDPALRAARTLRVEVQFETVTDDRLAVRLGELPGV